jgi:hypothetical protein
VWEILMKNSRVKSMRTIGTGSWSRRRVLATGTKALSLLALPQFMVQKAWAQTATFDFYISTSGSDSNPGTLASPWAITSATKGSPNNSKMAGKRTGFMPGTYSVNALPSPSAYEDNILAIPHGSSSAQTYWGTCDGSGNYSPGTATLATNGSLPFAAGGIVGENTGGGTNAVGYWTVDGFVIDGGNMTSGGHFVQAYGPGGIYNGSNPSACPGIIVQNCEMRNMLNGQSGNNDGFVFFEGTSGSIVRNCYFHNLQKPNQSEPHMHCIEEYGCNGNQYLYNTFANITNGATAVESKTGGAGTVVAYCYFYNVMPGSYGVIMGFDGAEGSPNSPATAYSVHHNIIDSCGQTKSVDVNNIDSQALNWYNNTVYNAPNSQFSCSGASAPLQHYNNIWATSGSSTSLTFTTAGLAICDFNCYASASRSGTSGFDAHSITSNPSFASTISPGSGPNQFKLASGSPCLSAGRVGGGANGAVCNMGAWDGTVTQIGWNQGGSSPTTPVVPMAPVLTVS